MTNKHSWVRYRHTISECSDISNSIMTFSSHSSFPLSNYIPIYLQEPKLQHPLLSSTSPSHQQTEPSDPALHRTSTFPTFPSRFRESTIVPHQSPPAFMRSSAGVRSLCGRNYLELRMCVCYSRSSVWMSLRDHTVYSKQAKQCLYIFDDPFENLTWGLNLNFAYRSRFLLISDLPLTRDASPEPDILSDTREWVFWERASLHHHRLVLAF